MTVVGGALAVMLVSLLLSWRKQRRDKGGGAVVPRDTTVAAREARVRARAEAAGFLPRERLDTERAAAPDPRVEAAVEAVVRGEWEPAAALVRASGTDWWLRRTCVSRLAERAAEDDAWLAAWERARPEDPEAALVRGASTVFLAWDIRGSLTADHTTAEQFRGFHQVLHQARADVDRAVALNPEDPTPLVDSISLAFGMGEPHEHMRELWARIVALDPYHFQAHWSALQYWCAKWRGSRELAMEFAESAAAEAPPESMLVLLPLLARWEHKSDLKEPFTSPRARAATDAALRALAAAPEARTAPQVRHFVAFFLAEQKRYGEAREQFRLIDGRIGSPPWTYFARPAEAYEEIRDGVLRKAR
ncbi:DUF4034 domain-containing protein [Streptomyces sp. SID11385]|uniref:DUF4034 domain-containing protein n=1 Tax=Streptomyces sp. SID11385 TaxID=2706031 RepID=UPI0013CB2D40|nr:DUF4034 domain-containing protein [Streptomyces sp. SID11385]NEA43971.1 DUF4034 domain-containing protein [Streptomyces sp. SID11385]